ncbi:hypothetical protein EIP91_011760 [Steccherinum ochraceum]|uniref:Uncharacterized protein n=1 Tax=Steccherinum ochraceum TaxID=92696 RepID=A0A4R0RRA2_9APHY|nr:hypothetical protein EIP91_011760 [Steccherinum ochraceum]
MVSMRFAFIFSGLLAVAASSTVPRRVYEARRSDDNDLVLRDVLETTTERQLATLIARAIGITTIPLVRREDPPESNGGGSIEGQSTGSSNPSTSEPQNPPATGHPSGVAPPVGGEGVPPANFGPPAAAGRAGSRFIEHI